MDSFQLAKVGSKASYCTHANKKGSGSKEAAKFLDHLSHYQFLKNSAPWSELHRLRIQSGHLLTVRTLIIALNTCLHVQPVHMKVQTQVIRSNGVHNDDEQDQY
jgi:hypothetical protein